MKEQTTAKEAIEYHKSVVDACERTLKCHSTIMDGSEIKETHHIMDASKLAIKALEAQAEEKSTFPSEGDEIRMYVDGEWKTGRVIKGYRYKDGIVTMLTADGKQFWCGQDRTDIYKPIGEDQE